MDIFSPDQLEKHVQELLPDKPPDGKHLAVIGDVTPDGIEAAAVWHYDSRWSQWDFIGSYEHTWTGDNILGARIVGYL